MAGLHAAHFEAQWGAERELGNPKEQKRTHHREWGEGQCLAGSPFSREADYSPVLGLHAELSCIGQRGRKKSGTLCPVVTHPSAAPRKGRQKRFPSSRSAPHCASK